MKITAGAVFAAVETIKLLAAVKLPIKGKYGISRIAAKLAPEYQVVAEQRQELFKKYGEEKDGQIQVLNGNLPSFMADITVLFSQEIEVDCPRVKLADLGDSETDVDLVALLPFIDGDTDEKTAPAA